MPLAATALLLCFFIGGLSGVRSSQYRAGVVRQWKETNQREWEEMWERERAQEEETGRSRFES